ncbi:hypothetical protein [Roseateles sp.]|uniref:hypothetical protein n=1 Tax=Roseateles sp. TaxID=1971397 RepID=UPI003D1275EF
MAEAPAPTLPELEAALARMVQERYPHAESDDEAELQAMAARDCEYLLTRIRILEAELVEANDEVKWIAPGHRSSPAQALKRIKALCARFPDLFQAILLNAKFPEFSGTPLDDKSPGKSISYSR